jgi:hypothetical protein
MKVIPLVVVLQMYSCEISMMEQLEIIGASLELSVVWLLGDRSWFS